MVAVFFFYGLAFFSMGIAIVLEGGRGSDVRLRLALRPLAVFGLLHGAHEWLEMFSLAGVIPDSGDPGLFWDSIRLVILAFSFLSLSGFGFSLLAPNLRLRRISLLAPLIQAAIWGFGIFIFREQPAFTSDLRIVADVWTRYIIGVPAALAACIGLAVQQREFRHAGMAEFGRDSLIAAIAFAWYGVIGQIFVRESSLPPSNVINAQLFSSWFGFPVQILRAFAAIVVAVSVIRFLRAFDAEIKRQIDTLQLVRLQEAQQKEALRGDLLRRIVTAQESERQRIARELHDETGQKLTAIGLGLKGVITSIEKDKQLARKNLIKLKDLSANSLDELQRLIADLRPSHLDDLGISSALRWYSSELRTSTDLNINIDIAGEEPELSDTVNITLFRVVQEALTNVIKHAKCQTARIELSFESELVRVSVVDDGVGFELDNPTTKGREAWGLLGMRERTSLLGGEFIVISAPGEGTRIEISIPYDQSKENNNDEEIKNDSIVIS